MREVISRADLGLKISARMGSHPRIRCTSDRGPFWAQPVRCERNDGGPNWRLTFDPKKVPEGYAEAWERIRPEFEEFYDLPAP
jgi:hypothetical protein